MSTRNNHDAGLAPGMAQTGEKPRNSLASKISSSYNRMFILCMSAGLFLMIIAFAFMNCAELVRGAKPWLDRIRKSGNIAEMVSAVNDAREQHFILLDEEDNILASSFYRNDTVSHFPVAFHRQDGITWMSLSERVDLPGGQRVRVLVFFNASTFLTKLAVTAILAVLIFSVSLVAVWFRGRMVTRKTFGVIDQLISTANSISSQNLNVRLNVSDTSDELHEMALTFNRMMDRLEKAYEKQNQFVSDASHELRTPISVIQGYARMLERWGKDDKDILQEGISAINKEAVNMQELVEKLLFIARNDRDTLLLVRERFSLSDMMEELVKETRMLNTGHAIKSEISPDIAMYGDHARIKQALRIFTDNALKYTPVDGAVTFGLYAENGYAVAVVEDTGIGIPEKDLPRIFDRFYRVDTARDRHSGGHGLGLSIARIIILRHGGRIKIASREGEGTRFSVYLPLGDEPEERRSSEEG